MAIKFHHRENVTGVSGVGDGEVVLTSEHCAAIRSAVPNGNDPDREHGNGLLDTAGWKNLGLRFWGVNGAGAATTETLGFALWGIMTAMRNPGAYIRPRLLLKGVITFGTEYEADIHPIYRTAASGVDFYEANMFEPSADGENVIYTAHGLDGSANVSSELIVAVTGFDRMRVQIRTMSGALTRVETMARLFGRD